MNFDEFVQQLQADVIERIHEGSGDNTFKENVLTQVLFEHLIDLGALDDGTACYCELKTSSGYIKANGYYYDDEEETLSLFITIPGGGTGSVYNIGKLELQQALDRVQRFFKAAINGLYKDVEQSSERCSMLRHICDVRKQIAQIRIFVLAAGVVLDKYADSTVINKYRYEFKIQVWDLQRIFRCVASGKSYESSVIDFEEKFGETISCISMKERVAEYISYVAIIPGYILSEIYGEYGSRLLELNVRSFLQVNGKVNKGIRSTLRTEPERFLAYNNGISASAEEMELIDHKNGIYEIRKIKGLQIVNGGQTVASIHRAAKIDKADLTNVYVQAKITIVDSGKLEEIVPLIARYANSQNKINEADFSANEPYHVELERLSERIWTPGEQSRWFFERARGQYQVSKFREATTPARKRKFEQTLPSSQKFSLTDLAKYINSWECYPYLVSTGSQKNFVKFMEELRKKYGKEWKPDVDYYKELIGKAILFKSTDNIVKKLKIPAFKANVVTYSISYLAYRTLERVNFLRIWQNQTISEGLAEALYEWCPKILDKILESAGSSNVGEWCKNPKCWTHVSSLQLDIPQKLQEEIDAEEILPQNAGKGAKVEGELSSEDKENLIKAMNITATEWLKIHGWGESTGKLARWQSGIALTLSGYAVGGWSKVPSVKQARQAVKILEIYTAMIKKEA